LNVKLSHLAKWLERRSEIVDLYSRKIETSDKFVLLPRRESSTHGNHLFVVTTEHREELAKFLGDEGIQTGIHYPSALTLLPPYIAEHYSYSKAYQSNILGKKVLSIPAHEMLSDSQVNHVIDTLNSF
jgi:dTDP-4-amino-4,6-dideoxygalactose transaminase